MEERIDYVDNGQHNGSTKPWLLEIVDDIHVVVGLVREGAFFMDRGGGGGIRFLDGAKGPSRTFSRDSGRGGAALVRWIAVTMTQQAYQGHRYGLPSRR